MNTNNENDDDDDGEDHHHHHESEEFEYSLVPKEWDRFLLMPRI